jgi:hypothetical protein
VQSSAVGVTVDLAGAKVGPNQTFYGRPKVVGSGVTAQSDPIAVLLTIDTYERALLDIEVRLPDSPTIGVRVNNKVALCPGSRDPCKEPVSGPATILEGLRAFVRYDTPVTNAGGLDSPSQPVQFEKNGKLIDLRSINTSCPDRSSSTSESSTTFPVATRRASTWPPAPSRFTVRSI